MINFYDSIGMKLFFIFIFPNYQLCYFTVRYNGLETIRLHQLLDLTLVKVTVMRVFGTFTIQYFQFSRWVIFNAIPYIFVYLILQSILY